MYTSILFFMVKMFDLFTTHVFLSKGIVESNFLYNKYGEGLAFALIYVFTFLIYLITKFVKVKEVHEIIKIYIAISFIVAIYNLVTIPFIR